MLEQKIGDIGPRLPLRRDRRCDPVHHRGSPGRSSRESPLQCSIAVAIAAGCVAPPSEPSRSDTRPPRTSTARHFGRIRPTSTTLVSGTWRSLPRRRTTAASPPSSCSGTARSTASFSSRTPPRRTPSPSSRRPSATTAASSSTASRYTGPLLVDAYSATHGVARGGTGCTHADLPALQTDRDAAPLALRRPPLLRRLARSHGVDQALARRRAKARRTRRLRAQPPARCPGRRRCA